MRPKNQLMLNRVGVKRRGLLIISRRYSLYGRGGSFADFSFGFTRSETDRFQIPSYLAPLTINLETNQTQSRQQINFVEAYGRER
jgi:hypothetical protein